MKILDKIKNIDNKFAWSFFGVLLAVAFFAYQEYYKKDITEITLQVLSKNNVLDINENISDLKILYKENELISLNKELKVINLKLVNTGNQNITQDKYDINGDWGLLIENGTIVNIPEVKTTSNPYITENIKKMLVDSDRIVLPKMILDSKSYFELKILLITQAKTDVKVTVFGKISGIDKYKYVEERQEIISDIPNKKSFLRKVFNLIANISGALFCLIIIGIIIESIKERVKKYTKIKKDNEIIEKFKKSNEEALNESYDFVFEMYRNHGITFLNMANDLLNNPNDLLIDLIYIDYLEKKKLDKLKDTVFENVRMTSSLKLKQYIEKYPRNNDLINVMERHQFIKIEFSRLNTNEVAETESPTGETESPVLVNIHLKEALEKFVEFLKYND